MQQFGGNKEIKVGALGCQYWQLLGIGLEIKFPE